MHVVKDILLNIMELVCHATAFIILMRLLIITRLNLLGLTHLSQHTFGVRRIMKNTIIV